MTKRATQATAFGKATTTRVVFSSVPRPMASTETNPKGRMNRAARRAAADKNLIADMLTQRAQMPRPQ
ncbi:hypothetical protein AWB79_07531 [Caballeronia hypogeia]|uniref:Uncharacterized protein n=1 Tax=Caballeronia hypogeia TaxID=1777140 RepID=A0A158DTI0_9BURK|nr:hypothetical protein [Caballeronia hypogeia]SAK97878.1 hypothetical protein AWB79_07531 [Caballeronia hypogeia]